MAVGLQRRTRVNAKQIGSSPETRRLKWLHEADGKRNGRPLLRSTPTNQLYSYSAADVFQTWFWRQPAAAPARLETQSRKFVRIVQLELGCVATIQDG